MMTEGMAADGGKTGSRRVQIRIREAREGDLEDVADLWEELVEHHRSYSDHFELSRDGRDIWERYLRERFAERSTKLIVAEEDDRLVGFMLCLLDPSKPIFKQRAVGVIPDAYVARSRRKKGVMKEMLAVALRWFEKNRVRAVEVSVLSGNLEARTAWAQLGFKPFMIRKRLDLADGPARMLIDGTSKSPAKRVVRKKRSGTG